MFLLLGLMERHLTSQKQLATPRVDTLAIMREYSQTRCEPPWSDRQLEHKVKSAMTTPDPRGLARGYLLQERTLQEHTIDGTDPFEGQEIICEEIEADDILATAVAALPPTVQDSDGAQWALLEQVRALGGLCEAFPSWVLSTAPRPQPGLTVGALLALGSAISARRFTFGGLVGSSYICAVADTGHGKGRPQACLDQALREVWAGVIGANDLSSTRSTINRIALATAQGTGLLLVLDEYGVRLKSFLDGKSGFQRDTRALLLAMSTIGTGTYVFATPTVGGGDDVTMTAPGLSIYASTTATAVIAAALVSRGTQGWRGELAGPPGPASCPGP